MIHYVMRGLDPRIPIDEALRDKTWDCRDEPGNDCAKKGRATCR
jgi:hypothetical protein